MMKFERANELLEYNPATGILLWRVATSNRVSVGGIAGHVSDRGYVIIGVDGVNERAQNIAWLLTNGVWPELIIDHKDCDRSNNRIANLRLATQRQNLGNTRRAKHNKSGIKGVFWDSSRQKWHAQISINNRSTSLGRYSNIEDARAAYEKAAQKHFGEFARAA